MGDGPGSHDMTNPHGTPRSPARRPILASHLILTGYGHWLSNDPRGSGSVETRKPALQHLGEIHHGRKAVQPPRAEVRGFYAEAKPLLEHATIWFDDAMRQMIAVGVKSATETCGYTLYAFCICANHAHALVRTHRDRAEMIWKHLADASRDVLRHSSLVATDHPVWSERPYKVFKYTDRQVRDTIRYVEQNPMKERLSPQQWDFVCRYEVNR